MLRFVLLSTLVSLGTATGYGGASYGGGSYGGGAVYGGLQMMPIAGGYGLAGAGAGIGGYSGGGGGAVVPAAVLSHHSVQHYDVPSSGYVSPTTIDVPANIAPINFVFRTASSPINVVSKHQGSPGSYRETFSQDEPHQLVHTVTKPIIQEVREVISPFRRITQTVEPVREEIQTLVARGVGAGGAGAGIGGGLAGGLGGAGIAGGLGGAGLAGAGGSSFGLSGLGGLGGKLGGGGGAGYGMSAGYGAVAKY